MPCAGRMCLPLSPLCLLQCVQFRGSPFSSFYSLINIAYETHHTSPSMCTYFNVVSNSKSGSAPAIATPPSA